MLTKFENYLAVVIKGTIKCNGFVSSFFYDVLSPGLSFDIYAKGNLSLDKGLVYSCGRLHPQRFENCQAGSFYIYM